MAQIKILKGFTPFNANFNVLQWKILTTSQICASNFWNLALSKLGHLCLLHVYAKSTIPPKFCTYTLIIVLESKGSVQTLFVEHRTICLQTYQWTLYLDHGLSANSIVIMWLTTYKLKNFQTMGLRLLW
jgi:hypothetical protein